MAGEPFCRSCGRYLQPGTVKCPDCGAPQVPGAAPVRRGFSRARIAAMFLAVSFGLAVFQGVWVLASPPDLSQSTPLAFPFEVAINGTVMDDAGRPAANVTVAVLGQSVNTTTDSEGHYLIEKARGGYLQVNFTGDQGNASRRAFLYKNGTVDAALGPPGAPGVRVDDESYRFVSVLQQVCGLLYLLGGILVFVGALAAWRLRNWGLALTGAIVSIPISLLLGAAAVIFVVMARSEFRRVP